MTTIEPPRASSPEPSPTETWAGRAIRPPVPASQERWLGDPEPDTPERSPHRPPGIGSIAAVGAVVLASVVAMNGLAAGAGSADQRGGPGGFGGPGGAPTGSARPAP